MRRLTTSDINNSLDPRMAFQEPRSDSSFGAHPRCSEPVTEIDLEKTDPSEYNQPVGCEIMPNLNLPIPFNSIYPRSQLDMLNSSLYELKNSPISTSRAEPEPASLAAQPTAGPTSLPNRAEPESASFGDRPSARLEEPVAWISSRPPASLVRASSGPVSLTRPISRSPQNSPTKSDPERTRFHQVNGLMRPVRMSRVSDVDWNRVHPSRAGVIIYTDLPNGRRFCLGVDRVSHELTDFGGGVSHKRDRTALDGALRELAEESLGIFGLIEPKDIQRSLVIYNSSTMIVMIPVTQNITNVTQQFRERVRPESEVSALVWITPPELQALINGRSSLGQMYKRVRNLLAHAGPFWNIL